MKYLFSVVAAFLLTAVCIFTPAPAAEAASDVSFQVTNVELAGDKITFKGNFVNNSENYQRVLKLDIKYTLSDIDGSPLLSGTRRIGDLSVDVGGDKVPFQFTVDDSHAHEYSTDDIAVWKIEDDVEIE